MKNLLFFLLFIPLVASAQRTSYDVKAELQIKVGSGWTLLTPDVNKLFKEYTSLRTKELRNLPEKQLIVINSVDGFCFSCQCPQGHIVLQGSGNCGYKNYGCGVCSDDGMPMQAYVQRCEGSPCGNQQGAN